MRWKILSLVLVLLFVPVLTLAASSIFIEPIKNSISLTETAVFRLSINNNAEEKQQYSLFSFVRGWDIEPFPLGDKVMGIRPGTTRTTTIKVKPTEPFNPGLYHLSLNIETDHGEKYTEILPVYINPEKPRDYLPVIRVPPLDIKEKINPQETQIIKLLLENRNPLNMPELIIKLQSDIPEFNKELSTSLSPLEKKSLEFTITPNPFQSPGEYFLFFLFEKDGESVKVIPQKIEILPLTPSFEVTLLEERPFLKIIRNLEVKNPGNVENTQNITLLVSFWENLFTESTPAKLLKSDGQRFLLWEVSLSPNGTIILTTTQNYRYPFYLLILILFLVAAYFYLKSPLTLSKVAASAKKDATLSELKVTLHLRNITKKPIKNIEVIDLIPGIADIEKSLDIGTLRPQEIKHSKQGTLVKWKLAELEPREDRLITYKIKSKLKILGTLKLPRAKVHYGSRGKRKTAYSPTFRISS